MSSTSCTVAARFLGENGGRFLTVDFRPPGPPRAYIIFLPPFGEEMNRCRAPVAEQARQFASRGYHCTLVDFYGTGDSEGALHEASFAIWRANIERVIDELPGEGDAPVVLWGLRLGGLVALEFAARSQMSLRDIILWQPVTSGKRYVTQILRQRVAALVGKDLPQETTQEIRQRLEDGQPVEISGYVLGGALVRDIEQSDPFAMGKLCTGTIYWLENISEPGQALGAGPAKLVENLEQQHNTVSVHLFADPPIWQLHKRDSAPELLAITGSLLP